MYKKIKNHSLFSTLLESFFKPAIIFTFTILFLLPSGSSAMNINEYEDAEWTKYTRKQMGDGHVFYANSDTDETRETRANGPFDQYTAPYILNEKQRPVPPWEDTERHYTDQMGRALTVLFVEKGDVNVRNIRVITYCPRGYNKVLAERQRLGRENSESTMVDFISVECEIQSKIKRKKTKKEILLDLEIEIKKQELKKLLDKKN